MEGCSKGAATRNTPNFGDGCEISRKAGVPSCGTGHRRNDTSGGRNGVGAGSSTFAGQSRFDTNCVDLRRLLGRPRQMVGEMSKRCCKKWAALADAMRIWAAFGRSWRMQGLQWQITQIILSAALLARAMLEHVRYVGQYTSEWPRSVALVSRVRDRVGPTAVEIAQIWSASLPDSPRPGQRWLVKVANFLCVCVCPGGVSYGRAADGSSRVVNKALREWLLLTTPL